MSSVATFPTQANNSAGYLSKVGAAARALLAALLAVKPYQELAVKEAGATSLSARVKAKFSPRERARDIAALYAEANRYESTMPNLSAELRFMASRG
ncbi:hypothetical protein [Janthinobacterium fluminis]|uniref:Uncharacterized protein n=1 Tax=Janthinobacterium fluminis TaxID=2987524 RepID=A0ABT5K2J2_9BURK|nr:hypothetical protein [Janthinobacterium fluminis]MDC8759204.1 hypothetical protein [Janthinobacterium fluminis]